MPNIKLTIEYDGTGFHGWQDQPNLRTIQSELRKALELVLRETPKGLFASGRTDAGVHARGQVVNFWVEQMPDLYRLQYAISNIMRGEVSVLKAEHVHDDFRACKDAICKQYRYVLLNRASPAVIDKGRVWRVFPRVDASRLREEAEVLIGKQDFVSFQGAGCGSNNTVKHITESEIIEEGDYITYRVVGDGFLKHMVRNIVGTLVQLAHGELKAKSMQEVLQAKDRRAAGMTAPAYALYMDWVKYPEVGGT